MNRDSGRVWINFKELREKLKFEEVLAFYKIEVRRKGDQHQGTCPLPGHAGRRDVPSFSVSLGKGIFQCFGCKAKGNVLEFAALMENVNPEDGKALRQVAIKLHRQFLAKDGGERKEENETPRASPPSSGKSVKVNAPLDFELKDLNPEHDFLQSRGFTAETMRHFGVGFCSRGMLKGKIAIPLHDQASKLIGYAGRPVDQDTVGGKSATYLFPETREREGTILEFNKSLFLYNVHRLDNPCEDLAVVRDIASVWWLHQHGIRNVVATMSDEPSGLQWDLIIELVSPFGKVWLMPGGTKAGETFARLALGWISPRRFVRWVKVDQGREPTEIPKAEIEKLFFLQS